MNDSVFGRMNKGRNGNRPNPTTGVGALSPRDREQGSGSGSRITESEIMAAVDRVPSLPAVVNQILMLVGQDKANAQDMEELVEQDMVIAGRLLKLVNSQFYGLPNKISSLQQAVAIVGFNSLRSLVLAASAAGLLQVPLINYGFAESGLWKNSVVTASLAKEIGLQAGLDREQADEYFIAGLLRDVGMLVLGPFLEKQDRSFRKDSVDDIMVAERQTLGYDHCWVGERVAEKWQLPEQLHTVIGKHHRIPKQASEEVMAMLATVRLSERLAYRANVGLVEDHAFNTQIDKVLIDIVGLSVDAFKTVVARVPEVVSEADTFEA